MRTANMGVFKVNGTDILELGQVLTIGSTEKRKTSTAFSSGKLNATGLSDSNKALANAPYGSYPNWGFHNIVGNKLKVNGVQDTVAKKGTRPAFNHYISACHYENDNSARMVYDAETGILTINGSKTVSGSVFIFDLCGGGGGGGAGGYSFWGSANGGGGGGGGASIFGLLDFNNMPGNSATVYVGASGDGGSDEGDGEAGGTSYINDGNGNRICTCGGGSGGEGDHREHDGGGGGSGGVVSCIADCSYFRCFGKQNGGNGGRNDNDGDGCAEMLIMTPDDVYCATFATSGGAKGGSDSHYHGGGGGAGGTLLWSPAWSGGHGGQKDTNDDISWGLAGGGGGGGGADAYASQDGLYGGGGSFDLYYDKDTKSSDSGISGL